MRHLRVFCVAAGFAGIFAGAGTAETLVVRLPGVEGEADQRSTYFDELLQLALEETRESDGPFRVEKSNLEMLVHGRALEFLKQGERINLLYFMTSIEHERELLPIRIPLLKGLMGYRIFLIRAGDQARFSAVRTLDDLRRLVAGQGHRWPDVDILEANGIKVEVGRSYAGLFGMLEHGRFDFFPRGVTEIWREAALHADFGLAIEEELMLVYPTALYFFVNRGNPELAQRIEAGLHRALDDGSFDRLFTRHNGALLERARMGARRVIRLRNPILPPETPLDDPRLWFHLHE